MPKPLLTKLIVAVVVILTVAGVSYAGLVIWRERIGTETSDKELVSGDETTPGGRGEFRTITKDGSIEIPTGTMFPTTEQPRIGNIEHIKFSGQIYPGQTFEKELTQNLSFRLTPSDYGWNIWVGDKLNPEMNFSFITYPFRGPNPTDIYAWHFTRNEGAPPPYPNFDRYERVFSFIIDAEDYAQELALIREIFRRHSDEEVGKIEGEYKSPRIGRGVFMIMDLELEPPTEIKSMLFDVDIYIPLD